MTDEPGFTDLSFLSFPLQENLHQLLLITRPKYRYLPVCFQPMDPDDSCGPIIGTIIFSCEEKKIGGSFLIELLSFFFFSFLWIFDLFKGVIHLVEFD